MKAIYIISKYRSANVGLALAIAVLFGCTPNNNPHSLPPTAVTETQQIPLSERDVNEEDSIVSAAATISTFAAPAAEEITIAPKINVTLVNYQQLIASLEKHRGKIVVLDVWSNSCVPCMREFPHLVALSNRWPDEVRCVSLNVDYIGLKSKPPETYTPKIEAFVNAQKANFENFQASDSDETILKNFKLESIPGILLFDRDGKLHSKFTDANSGDDGLTYQGDVIPTIEKLLHGTR